MTDPQVFEPKPYVVQTFTVTITNPGTVPLHVRYGDGYNLQETIVEAGGEATVTADSKWKVEILQPGSEYKATV